jgi:hypothetical protein
MSSGALDRTRPEVLRNAALAPSKSAPGKLGEERCQRAIPAEVARAALPCMRPFPWAVLRVEAGVNVLERQRIGRLGPRKAAARTRSCSLAISAGPLGFPRPTEWPNFRQKHTVNSRSHYVARALTQRAGIPAISISGA